MAKRKTKKKPWTSVDQYLFSLTGSEAITLDAKRAVLRRFDLAGLSRADVREVQESTWRKLRKSKPDVPSWVLALQQDAQDWRHRAPSYIPRGKMKTSGDIACLAYSLVDWGRSRKRSRGKSCVRGARVREVDNGCTGWNRVVNRYADYGCIVSPCNTKLAVSVRCDEWKVVSLWRGRFFFEGRLCSLDKPAPSRQEVTVRFACRALQRAGFDAYLTYQSYDEIRLGAGDKHPQKLGDRLLVCIVNFGEHGYYHLLGSQGCNVVQQVRQALAVRQRDAAERKLEQQLRLEPIFVGVEDSLQAGNCEIGTEAFRRKLPQYEGCGAIRSDVLLRIRDDCFTVRAVRQAHRRLKRQKDVTCV